MQLGPAIIVSNSLAQLERLVDLRKANGADTLRTLPEYTFFRSRYPRGGDDESALLIISDATIRRWSRPVGESRFPPHPRRRSHGRRRRGSPG